MNTKVNNMLGYYRNSMNDSKLKEIDHKNLDDHNMTSYISMSKGQIESGVVESLFYEKFKTKERIAEAIQYNWSIDVILCPIEMNVNVIHGKQKTFPNKIIPLMIPAKLSADGCLGVIEKQLPWIARKLLTPTKLDAFAVSSLKKFDAYFSKYQLPRPEDGWGKFWLFIETAIEAICHCSIKDFKLNHYTITPNAYVVLNDNNIDATLHLTKFCESSLVEKKLTYGPLIKNVMTIDEKTHIQVLTEEEQYDRSKYHFGQMTNAYPLSPSQRESLIHYMTSKEGDVFAVNGPPGTGKTTLLQTIIANEYVNNALMKKEPPMILATSNNNQAVTNIIDSFGDVFSKTDILGQRWIPSVKSFGTYLASMGRVSAVQDKYQVMFEKEGRLSGFEDSIVSEDNIEQFKCYYLEFASKYFGIDQTSQTIKKIIERVHKKLKAITNDITEIIESVQKNKGIIESIELKYNGNIDNAYKKIDEDLQYNKSQKVKYDALEGEFIAYLNGFGFIKRLLMKLSFTSNFFRTDFRRFIHQEILLEAYNGPFNYIAILEAIEMETDNYRREVIRCRESLTVVKKDKEYYKLACEVLMDIANSLQIEEKDDNLSHKNIGRTINERLDETKRYEAFRLSTHYYEGLWILEVEKNLLSNYVDRKNRDKRIKHWQRISKLTPCYVSTFYMIPKFMETGYYQNQWVNEYLYEHIDLLIVDEAGQASSEVSLPLFALAKKAVIVGDELQIEPVWSVSGYTDEPNVEMYLPDVQWQNFYESKYAASCGNLMTIAKRRSEYEKYGEGGLYLTEHRRCIPDIINYNNELAYKGKLVPMRKNELKDYPFPHMGHIHVEGRSEKINSSRRNKIEAERIASWIIDNSNSIMGYYNNDDNSSKQIHEIVAVVTPFKAQSNHIRRALNKHEGFELITVGTVHALQGAERNIVLFSSVYSENDPNSYFYNKGVNMLNVAVSRAKDAFIVFGDKAVMNKEHKSHSGLLAKYFDKNVENYFIEKNDI